MHSTKFHISKTLFMYRYSSTIHIVYCVCSCGISMFWTVLHSPYPILYFLLLWSHTNQILASFTIFIRQPSKYPSDLFVRKTRFNFFSCEFWFATWGQPQNVLLTSQENLTKELGNQNVNKSNEIELYPCIFFSFFPHLFQIFLTFELS